MLFTEDCLICGKELEYSHETSLRESFYCGREFNSGVSCPENE